MEQQSKVSVVKEGLPPEELLLDVADLFKTFADSTRVKILAALTIRELSVGELAEVLDMTISAVSHQLRLLRIAKLVRQRRSGKEMIYALDDEHVHDLYEIAVAHLNE